MDSWVGDIILHGSIAILVPLVAAFLIKKYPFAKPVSGFSIPDQPKKLFYKRYDNYLTILKFLTLPFIILFFYALSDINHTMNRNDKLAKIIVTPNYFSWCSLGVLIWIGTLANITEFWAKILLRSDYKDYILYSNVRSGYNSFKAAKIISIPFWVFSLIALYFLWNFKATLYNDHISYRDALDLKPRIYSYKDIKSIAFIDTGKVHLNVLFKDKTDWDTTNGDLSDDSAHTAVKFIAKKSGLKIDTLTKHLH